MRFRDLYYYTWSPDASRMASAASNSSTGISPDGTHDESYWTWPTPGRKTLCWLLVLFIIVFLGLVLSIAVAPSSTSTSNRRSTNSALMKNQEDGGTKDKDTSRKTIQASVGHVENSGKVDLAPPTEMPEQIDIDRGCISDGTQFDCDEPGQPSKVCIPSHLVCNGKADCRTARDELSCIALSRNASFLSIGIDAMPSAKSKNVEEGYVLVRINGVWHPYCSNEWTKAQFDGICYSLGFSTMGHEIRHNLTHFNEEPTTIKGAAPVPHLLVLSSDDDVRPNKVVSLYADEEEVGNLGWSRCEVAYLKCR